MVKIHEHIIEVTNPGDQLYKELNATKLWQHLQRYVRHPHEYFEPLESATVQERRDNDQLVLQRQLNFGTMTVNDEVFFEEGKSIVIKVKKTQHYQASTLTIKIEQPQENGALFLRFVYEEETTEMPAEDIFLKLRRKAYEQKDMDMVHKIREQAASLSKVN